MLALFESVAAGGLSNLTSQQFHQVDKAHGIYELIAGRLRVLFFNTESGRIIICTHLFMKQGQKTPDSEKARARRIKKCIDGEGIEWIKEL